jgi:Tfp pilus assembly protein PilX
LSETNMRKNTMQGAKFGSRGFTLIASLLLVMLLSGFAIALLMMVNSEQRAGNNDLSNNYTYRAAEGAMEKMTSDLANTFKSIQAPTSAQICAVSSNPPTWDPTVTYTGAGGAYNVSPVNPGVSNPCSVPLPPPVWGPVQSGPDAGLYAQIIPVTMNVTAQRVLGNSETVSMTRTAEVALIPVFQFGVFCDGDCFFGRSPNLTFAGRVHTNGDLYLGVADGANLVFGDKISAFGNVIRQQMDNGVVAAGNDDGGTVMIPTTSGGCATQLANVATATPSATCVDIATQLPGNNGSVVGGHGSAQYTPWYNVSYGSPYQQYIIDGNGPTATCSTCDGPNSTGASNLTLPFVQGTTFAYQLIRRPPVGESVTSLLGGSRLANQAQIRVLLSDKEADLHLPGWNGDVTQDVELASLAPEFTSTAFSQNGIVVNGTNTYYFGESACGTLGGGSVGHACTNGDTNFVWPPWVPGGTAATQDATQAEWPLVNGWLLVEVLNSSSGLWVGVTKEWLQLGFARGLQVPTAPGSATAQATNVIGATGSNFLTDHRNAILYFQQTADRNGNGSISSLDAITFTSVAHGAITTTPTVFSGSNSQYNWYPINLYDAREGENNDVAGTFAHGTGTPNGIMNAVELDVGNLRRWLLGQTGSTGSTVNYVTENGYVLYFSDRRGMQYDPVNSPTALLGEYGFEDTVNYVNAGNGFAPDGRLEPNNYNGVSPEDVNQDGLFENYGVKTVGDAFGTQTTNDTDTANPPTPYAPNHRIQTFTIGRANRVTGARHSLKLVDASLGNLPTMPPGNSSNNCAVSTSNPTGCGGFTVASENPVYVQGNYNSNCPTAGGADCTPGNTNYDATWTNPPGAEPTHAAAAVIADAVSILSNNWQDAGVSGALYSGSLQNPTNPGGQSIPAGTPNRIAVTTYYRMAIAGGKNIAFLNTSQNPEFSFGMDGGIHNFLRFLEDWGGQTSQQNLNYKGSLVSLYYATYATGTFKCCNLVYNPPDRNYIFDPLFSSPQNLPPGTPMFRNVDNLSYRQNQLARQN